MTRPNAAIVAAAAAALFASHAQAASAQTMRTLSISRPVTAERALYATLDFSGGTVVLGPAAGPVLYGLKLRYDAEQSAPIQQYDPRTGILRLGMQSTGGLGVRVSAGGSERQVARFQLASEVALTLDANIGAADASLDLGGTNLTSLTVNISATHGTVDFSAPTRGTCRFASFSVGASQLEVHHLARSNCAEVRVDGAAGGTTLDFDGAWRRDMSVVVALAMGSLTLRLPRGTGVRISGTRFLSPFDHNGFVKTGEASVTPGYAQAPHKLDVDLKASVVGIRIEWIR